MARRSVREAQACDVRSATHLQKTTDGARVIAVQHAAKGRKGRDGNGRQRLAQGCRVTRERRGSRCSGRHALLGLAMGAELAAAKTGAAPPMVKMVWGWREWGTGQGEVRGESETTKRRAFCHWRLCPAALRQHSTPPKGARTAARHLPLGPAGPCSPKGTERHSRPPVSNLDCACEAG